MDQSYLAFDLGAESGRAILGRMDRGKLSLVELHRFPNQPQRLPDGLHWNLLDLWNHLLIGLRKAGDYVRDQGLSLVSLGVDAWGVDYGLIGQSGQLLGLPFCYRDIRHAAAMKKAVAQLGATRIYDVTGIQFLPFNTLYQLVAERDAEPALLEQAKRLLFIPDLLHYFFTGEMVNEQTIASTSQMLDLRDSAIGKWADDLFEALHLPPDLLGPVVPSGTRVGKLLPHVAEVAGVSADVEVIAPASHDTASAVAAVPAERNSYWAYLSSGTWSLMGVELDQPLLTDAAREAGFTNEGGVNGTIRFLKNISGLWLVQECRRAFERKGDHYDYSTLTRLAGEAGPFRTLVDPDDPDFMQPGHMLEKLSAFARRTDQPVPETPGQFVRCCLESLALTYHHTLEKLEDVLDRRVEVLHIVGGGGQNHLLNQMTADAIGRRVVVGPYEATAIGNLLVQAMGRGDLRDLEAMREVVRASFPLQIHDPVDSGAWRGAFGLFRVLCNRASERGKTSDCS